MAKPAKAKEPEFKGSAKEALASLRKGLDAKYKKSVISTFTKCLSPVSVIPTGVVSFDKALSVGGFPRGRVIELYGPPGGGKTTLALHTIAQAQRMGYMCLFLDFEHALEPAYAQALGVDLSPSKFVLAQPECMEEGVDILTKFLRMTKALNMGIVVIDSIASMTPKKMVESEDISTANIALHSSLVARFLNSLIHSITKANITLLCLNQVRTKISFLGGTETTPGGNALKHDACVRCEVRRIKVNELRPRKDDKDIVSFAAPASTTQVGDLEVTVLAKSSESRFKIVKSKVGNPFRCATATLEFGKGFDFIKDYWEVCYVNKLFQKGEGRQLTWVIHHGKKEIPLTFTNQESFTKIFSDNPTYKEFAYQTLMQAKVGEVVDLGGAASEVEATALELEKEFQPPTTNAVSPDGLMPALVAMETVTEQINGADLEERSDD